ncbi:ABC transporter substrate-binding protein [Fusobacterium sp. PH5-44]|uniref:ABC transporter substrate-binding protein n=1 Tax=unclassified Fusobacterium TaxID=2648384 RepID=UPI003D24FB20
MKRIVKKLILLGVLITKIGIFAYGDNKISKIKIGISQIAEHPAMDENRQGILDGMRDSGYSESKVEIHYKNAQGDFPTMQLISKEFGEKVDILVPIGTQSTQAAVNATKEKPIIFSVVAYPESSGILNKNVTGVSNQVPVEKQIELIKTILPQTKVIGTIYNTSEKNSTETIEKLEKYCDKNNYKLIKNGITAVHEIVPALDVLLEKIDILYTSNDHLLASAYPLIVEKCKNKNIPIIGVTENFAEQGALAIVTASEYDTGYQTGKLIGRYLDGSKIEEMPYEILDKATIVINREVAERYNINLEINELKNIKIIK